MPGLARSLVRLRHGLGITRVSPRSRPAAAGARHPPARLGWTLRGLLVAAVAVPLLLLAVAAWQNYRLVQKDAEVQVANTTGEMREQALKVFDTYALVLRWVEDRASRPDWEHIQRDEDFHRFLSDLGNLPQIDTVRVIDAAGKIRASGRFFPVPPANVAERDYFIAHKAARISLYIGSNHIGKLTHAREFDISRRLSTPDGGFGGVVTVSARPSYFRDFYRAIAQRPEAVALLVRDDGAVLVRAPALPREGLPMEALPREGPLMRALASGRAGGLFRAASPADAVERLYGYQRIPGFPVAVVYGIPTAGVLAAWRANLLNYALFAVPASLGLFFLTLLVLRQLQRHALLSWRWRTTAQRLRREMRRREVVEKELRQTHKMEALGQLTGGVAHDFNNLLAVVQISLEMLKGRQAGAELEARLALALDTVARGERLVGQLLAFARRHPLKVESVDLNAQVRVMAELLARTVGGRVRIETDLAPALKPAWVDANQLELAIINLAVNARDAMPEGGVLYLRTRSDARRVALPEALARAGGEFVVLEISDTGCGMAPEVVAHAFEPFFTTKEPGRGTGLGLSTVYGFARQSGGTAVIRSALGQGTTVILVLPASRPPGSGEGLPAGTPA